MFPLTITLKNYRCFKASSPAQIQIRPGFTAFVGANNAGKSTLLRFFYELRGAFGQLASPGNFLGLLTHGHSIGFPGTEDPIEVYFGREEDSQELIIEFDFPAISDSYISRLRLMFQRATTNAMRVSLYLGQQHTQITGITRVNGNIILASTGDSGQEVDIQPIIETMILLERSIYIASFRNAIHEGGGTLYDLPIGTTFISQWDQWKAGTTKGSKLRMQEVSDDIARIFGFTQLDINASQDGKTLEVVADRNPQRLRELGAGLHQFIVVLAFIAMRTPPFLLIDEPELNLHPSLQVRFLTTLAKYTKYGVIFATHSIGLARTTAEYIYSVRKSGVASVVKPYKATEGFAEFLGEMSFSTYRDVGYDTVLCVEGPSEITAVQEFLRKLRKDHRIALLQLGGSSMICGNRQQELAELKRFSSDNKIAVLIDSERDQASGPLPPDRQEFVNVCKALGFTVATTDWRATENYFPERAIQEILGTKYRALQPYEPLKNAQFGWNKTAHNWRIAQAMTKDELLMTDFGQFLDSL